MVQLAPSPNAPEPNVNSDVNPSGFKVLTGVNGDSGKLIGSAGNDKVTISDLQADRDQVIKTGAGDDLFNFAGSESRLPQNLDRVNALLYMGDGDGDTNDTVLLAFQQQDYSFTVKADGGIKVQYVGSVDLNGDGNIDSKDVDGVAVTFYGADKFTFTNIDDTNGTNYATYTLTTDQLKAQITTAELMIG